MIRLVNKAVVLAAGEGTRLYPITEAVPKEMVRVGKKPTIEHALEVLKAGGIEHVMIILGRKKGAVLDYLGSGDRLDLNVCYRIQEEPKGTAHALSLARNYIGQEDDFVVMYGDNYISPYDAMGEIVNFHEENGQNTLVLHPVEDPRRFGVVKLDEDNRIRGMIEKPTMDEARPYKRNGHWLNIAGLMMLESKIFDYIDRIDPIDGELWLTDAMEAMRKDGNEIYGYVFEGTRYDIGTFESLSEADRQAQDDDNFH